MEIVLLTIQIRLRTKFGSSLSLWKFRYFFIEESTPTKNELERPIMKRQTVNQLLWYIIRLD